MDSEDNKAAFITSLKTMYENTPENDRQLKDIAIRFAHTNAAELVKDDNFVSNS